MPMTQNGALAIDDNEKPVMGGTSSADNTTIINSSFDPITRRLLTDSAAGSGTVTSVSVATANGFAGTVANPTTTPAITISTTVTGVLYGNGTSVAAATGGQLPVMTSTVGGAVPTPPNNTTTFLRGDGTFAAPSGGGDVTGPASSTDNAIARFDLTTGKIIQNSVVTVADTTGVLAGTQGITFSGSTSGTLALVPTAISGTNTITLPASTGTVALTSQLGNLTVGTSTITGGANTRILYDNSGILGEYTLTGTGTVVAMQTAPIFATSITTPSVLATANDSGALGASGTAFSDLFLASGAVINFNAGNVTLTHSAGILTQNAGELRVTSANVGTNADSVPTLSSTSTFTNKTLTSPTITTANLSGKQLLAEGASIALDPAGSADGAYSGITVTAVAGYTQAFGDLVYLAVADSRWELADADAAATAGPVALAMVVVAGTDGAACTLLLQGIIRADAKFPTMTVGATQFVGETAGAIQGTIPTGADNVIRTVGYALTADELYFAPSTDWQVTVA